MEEYEEPDLTEAQKESLYAEACRRMEKGICEWELMNAAGLFEDLGDWKDAAQKHAECLKRAEEMRVEALYRNALRQMKQVTSENGYLNTAEAFRELKGYKDAEGKRAECLRLAAESRLNDLYTEAMKIFHREKLTANDCLTARMLFEKLPGYKDADAQAALCGQRAKEVAEQKILDDAAEQKKRHQKKNIKRALIAAVVLAAAAIIAVNVFDHL